MTLERVSHRHKEILMSEWVSKSHEGSQTSRKGFYTCQEVSEHHEEV